MHSLFRSKKTKTKRKSESFYHRENLIQTEFELSKVLGYLDSAGAIKSKSDILFRGIELGSIDKKIMERELGKEFFLLKPDSNISGHEICFYHISFEGLRFLAQLHFIDGQFFFAANKVYSDMFLSDSDKDKIVSRIKNKYCPDADREMIEFELIDDHGNILSSNDNVYYFIRYLANNNTSQKLKAKYEGYERPVAEQENKNQLDSLI